MKKLYLLILSFLFVFGVVACTNNPTTNPTTADNTTTVVTEENELPTILGVTNLTIQQLEDVDLLEGITATDVKDGDLTSSLAVDLGDFTNLEPGDYDVTVYVTDSDNNRAEETFTVTVTAKEFNNTDWAYYDVYSVELTTPLTLPKWTGNGTYFYWATSNKNVITSEGFIINPPVGSDPEEVILTCTAINGTAVIKREFPITVQPNQEVSVTSKVQVPFYGTSDEYVVEDDPSVNLFFVDNGTVPYIDIEEFINMVDGAIEAAELTFTPDGTTGLSITYSIEYTDIDEVTLITENFEAYIDFEANTFTVNNYDFFGSYISSTESDYGSGLIYTGADYVDGEEVTIPLGNYNFDLIIYEEGGETYYLMPFAVTNLLFLGDVYYDAYYNGDEIWGVSLLLTPDEDQDSLYDQIRTSSLNSEDMQDDMLLASYNFMALMIDYFYGLKEDKNIQSGYDILSAYAKSILTGTDSNLYDKLFDIAYGLDDLHTSHTFPGYYETPYGMGLSLNDLGAGTKAFYEYLWNIQDKLIVKYGGDPDVQDSSWLAGQRPEYSLLDNNTIAVIHIDGFDIDYPDKLKTNLFFL